MKIKEMLQSTLGDFELPLPCHVNLIRHCTREYDYVNLVASMKGLQDQVADKIIPGLAMGRADGDKRITWDFKQAKDKNVGVTVEICKL